MTDFIRFENFSFQYQAQAEPTLKDINLTIQKGAKVLIVGPSGSGKSTLGQCLNGLIPNSYKGTASGVFTIEGKDAFTMSIYDKSQLVSTILQDTDGQFIGLTVAEDLAFALENDCLSQPQMIKEVTKWAELLDLTAFLNHRPQDLSGGQKQRVSLAGVLIDESPILLFDEPLANLDPKSGQDTIALIDDLHKQTGATTIIIEHRLEDVLYRSVDQIILINDGQIVFNGSPNELLKTELLAANGIREPLYVTSLRQLGYPVAETNTLSQWQQLDLSDLKVPEVQSDYHQSQLVPLLEVEELTFGYDVDKPILRNLSLTLNKGERVAILGKNGAGKSTLAKALCGFVTASGKLYYQGQDISSDSIKERADRIGYVLQNPNQMISQPMIFDEVALGLRLRGLEEREIARRVEEVLEVCGLHAFRKWPISALSYGQKKRVTIASVLVLNPEIILLDEPTAGQDQKNYTDMMAFLDSLAQLGHTIVMITHDMQLMMEYSERSLVLLDGQLVADVSPIEVLSNPDLLAKAHLKPTSLFQLAEKLDVSPQLLTDYYISHRKESSHDN